MRADLLKSELGIRTFADLVRHYPFRHIDRSKFTPLNYIPGMRSQDLRPSYYENGLLYITHRDLIKEGIIFDQNSFAMIVDHPFGQVDIDNPDDLRYAEFIFNATKF